ncbi:anti-anti-sigma factor [Eubacterium sp. 14-2]|uniref:STAS domain-containing protein n=1 Tax=Eubacterium sp. 14-2 TaxID=1235790 RepID=UPI00033F1C01|nr:STAS domain-containing protein [Eubacterium sp. 14-2]EOT24469.1 anti-anti-sigma factor [Eubacterium sp. 14-2]
MIITKTTDGTSLTLVLEGRLDTMTAPQLESELRDSIEGIDKLFLDFASLEYISSAGLRILLSTQKIMNKQGSMVIRNANEGVMDIFDITGFADILTIE